MVLFSLHTNRGPISVQISTDLVWLKKRSCGAYKIRKTPYLSPVSDGDPTPQYRVRSYVLTCRVFTPVLQLKLSGTDREITGDT